MTRLGFQLVLLGLVSLLATVAVQCEPTAPLATSSPRPIVSLISPPNNATLVLNEPVPVRALIKDSTGVLRVDLVVDGAIVDSQSLVFASFQYDYQYSWKPILLGAHNIAVLGYNSNSVVSDPASVRVNVVMPVSTATPKAQTITITPAASATGTLSLTPSRTWTPRLVVVTPTPLASGTATRTPTFTRTPFVIVVTETPGPTRTPTSSPTLTGTK